MAKISGSGVKLNIGKETTPGTSATAFQTLKSVVVGESLNSSATELQSQAITPIRDIAGLRNGLYSSKGTLGFEAAAQGVDVVFEGVLGSVVSAETAPSSGLFKKTYTRPTTNILPSYTFERVYNASNTQVYNNLKFDKLTINYEAGSLITMSADVIMGKSTAGTAQIDATPDVFPHLPYAGIDANLVSIDGTPVKTIKASITITNGLEEAYVLGNQFADDIVEGVGEVSGDIELYFENRTYYDLFNTETEFELIIESTRGTNKLIITIPRCKFSGNRDTTISTDKALIQTYTFKGIQDDTINGAIKVEVINADA